MKPLLSALALIFALMTLSLHTYAFDACHANTYPFLRGAKFFTSSTRDRMAYRTSGKEDAETVVVFLNGLNKDMSQWISVRDRLMAKHSDWSFVQTDLLGQGSAIHLNGEPGSEISFERQILLLKELISTHQWQNKKLILVGHSYGGGIAARFAAENPNWVKQNVLISPFVDNLEIYQPTLNGMGWWTKQYADHMGMKSLYETNVQLGAAMGMGLISTFDLEKQAKVRFVIALTNGIRNLQMDWSASQAGGTKTHLVIGMADELIPERPHALLWKQIPEASQGLYIRKPTTHDSVEKDPDLITEAIDEALH